MRRLLVITVFLAACAPQVSKISGRNPDLFEKESDHLAGRSRGAEGGQAPEMFVKEKSIAIKDTDRPNETGSLFNVDDERNYLFTAKGPLNVGRFLKVRIVFNRTGGKGKEAKEAKEASDKAKGGKEGKDKEKDKEKDGELEAELLKILPQLEPAVKGEPELLRSFKMQIMHRFDNGDVLAMMTRQTAVGDQASEISVSARIPYDRLASGDELTTDDLLDVRIRDTREGELAERTSSGWEDEYSLRLSGFNEAKSKAALELADQKKKLAEVGEKLDTRIKTLGDERAQVAKQRDELNQKKAASEQEVSDLQDKVKEQEDTIQKQEQEIKELTPEEKPNDGKEGANG